MFHSVHTERHRGPAIALLSNLAHVGRIDRHTAADLVGTPLHRRPCILLTVDERCKRAATRAFGLFFHDREELRQKRKGRKECRKCGVHDISTFKLLLCKLGRYKRFSVTVSGRDGTHLLEIDLPRFVCIGLVHHGLQRLRLHKHAQALHHGIDLFCGHLTGTVCIKFGEDFLQLIAQLRFGVWGERHYEMEEGEFLLSSLRG